MRPAVLAAGLVLVALLLLGTATATWLEVATPVSPVDGVVLPAEATARAGVDLSPPAAPAALLAFVAALPTALVGLADRTGRAAGTTARAAATALGVMTTAVAAVAVGVGASSEEVQAAGMGNLTAAIGLFALGGALVPALTAATWAVPRDRTPTPSRYTVEAARAGGSQPADPAETASHPADSDDEWDLAVTPDTATADTENPDTENPDAETDDAATVDTPMTADGAAERRG